MVAAFRTRSDASRPANITRLVVGLIWLAGAAFNLFVTLRMARPFEWLEESPVPLYRWFFRDVVGPNPEVWTVLLVAGEIALGVLTLARGGWARLGLAGGALFSAVLVSFGTAYTLIMGPYALLLLWLARKEYRHSPFDWLQERLKNRGRDSTPHPV